MEGAIHHCIAEIHQRVSIFPSMKHWTWCLIIFAWMGCREEEPAAAGPTAPLAVAKSNPLPVLAHVMPWFETLQHDGAWGHHWTMAHAQPWTTGGDGLPDVASHYHPFIGPYSSFDEDVLEYHTLLMKYSGIDGAIIDWYGTSGLLDYGRIDEATEALIAALRRAGLEYALMYEDRTLANVPAGQAALDWAHIAGRHFTDTAYFRVEGEPWVGVFGPIELETPEEWAAVGVSGRTFAIWGEGAEMGADGEFAWIWGGGGVDHLAAVAAFSEGPGARTGVAYPGFKDFYADGGWGAGLGWEIAHNQGQTLLDLLEIASNADLDALQLATWNDFGEGTMIEPTHEFGFSPLESVQGFTGVAYGLPELELIHELYLARKAHAGDPAAQTLLDEAFRLLVRLDPDAARAQLAAL